MLQLRAALAATLALLTTACAAPPATPSSAVVARVIRLRPGDDLKPRDETYGYDELVVRGR